MLEKEPREKEDKVEIKEMPDKETLEKFLEGLHGHPKVYFDRITGKFIVMAEPEDD